MDRVKRIIIKPGCSHEEAGRFRFRANGATIEAPFHTHKVELSYAKMVWCGFSGGGNFNFLFWGLKFERK